MPDLCPRCSKPVKRSMNRVAVIASGGGLAGALIAMAFGSFECVTCGKIPKAEFSPEVRSKMMMGSVYLILGAVLLIIAVIAILVVIAMMR